MEDVNKDHGEDACNPGFVQASGIDGETLNAAKAFLERHTNPGEVVAGERQQDTFYRQQLLICDWAVESNCLIQDQEFDCHELVSNSTSEHEVRYREADDRALKRTWAGIYGQIPCINNDYIDRRIATPLEYLNRLILQNQVFDSTFVLEGVCVSERQSLIIGEPPGQPSLVVSQRWVGPADPTCSAPSTQMLEEFMTSAGFRRAPSSYFGWWRPEDGVAVVDAKPDNFVMSTEGVIPIDLQMAQFSLGELEQIHLVAENRIIILP